MPVTITEVPLRPLAGFESRLVGALIVSLPSPTLPPLVSEPDGGLALSQVGDYVKLKAILAIHGINIAETPEAASVWSTNSLVFTRFLYFQCGHCNGISRHSW